MESFTPKELATICGAMFGDFWQAELARWLPCDPRTARRWAAGERGIPLDITKRLRDEFGRRRWDKLLAQVDQIVKDAGGTPAELTIVDGDSKTAREIVRLVSQALKARGFKVTVRPR